MKKKLQHYFYFLSFPILCWSLLAFSVEYSNPVSLRMAKAHLASLVKKTPFTDDYEINKKLEEGGTSSVFLGSAKTQPGFVAIRETDVTDKDIKSRELKGLAILMQLQEHSHVVKVKDIYLNDTTLYVVMEYLEGGDLARLISESVLTNKSAAFSQEKLKKISREVLETLHYFHQRNVVYRDLKPENLLFRDLDQTEIVFVDFGFTTINDLECVSCCGTAAYAAPELYTFNAYTEKVDIWSFGCFLYRCALLDFPFKSKRDIVYGNFRRTDKYKKLDKKLRKIIKASLRSSSKKRSSAEELLSKSWFQDQEEEESMSLLGSFMRRLRSS